MLDSLSAPTLPPEALAVVWPDADNRSIRWVEQPRIEAPGLDSLLTWAFNAGASRISTCPFSQPDAGVQATGSNR
jgi:hypothetical protein